MSELGYPSILDFADPSLDAPPHVDFFVNNQDDDDQHQQQQPFTQEQHQDYQEYQEAKMEDPPEDYDNDNEEQPEEYDNEQEESEEEEEESSVATPAPVLSQASHAVSPAPTQHSAAAAVASTFSPQQMSQNTNVDGHGMWTSWTRVFDQPRYACFDLLDNCLDATLQDGFHGKVVMNKLPPNGIVILNNSHKRIKPLKDVLVVYGSTKGVGANQKRDAIGENGVGLKHGCATLSNTSFVLTRNEHTFAFGVIAKALQTKEGVCLPSVEFTIENAEDKTPEELSSELRAYVANIVEHNPKIGECVKTDLGHGDLSAGIHKLEEHLTMMWDEVWGEHDHVFQVLMTDLIHSHSGGNDDDSGLLMADAIPSNGSRRNFDSNNPASLFLNQIKTLLPKFYINIPMKDFEFYVEGEKIRFSYWQHRLVELTKFTVNVPKEEALSELRYQDWEKTGYPLSIYCGFDALRVADDERSDACAMFIYSRRSGRLIQIDDDARNTLRLAASGSDYQQGLTIIIDDIGAELPLMPTKQGIAWSEQRGGEIHKKNLYAWAGGAAQCFWNHHARQFKEICKANNFKSLLKDAVKNQQDRIRRHLYELTVDASSNRPKIQLERLELENLTRFVDVDWKKERISGSNNIWRIKKVFQRPLNIEEGKGTRFKFRPDDFPPPELVAPARKKAPFNPAPAQPLAQMQAQQFAAVAYAQQQQLQQQQFPPHMYAQQFRPPPQLSAQFAPPPVQQQNNNKKRKLGNNNNGGSSGEIICLDDSSTSDEDWDEKKSSSSGRPRGRRQVARKSTGGHAPAGGGMANGNPTVVQDLQRLLRTCQSELHQQKRLMAETQKMHQETVRKLKEELELAKQASKSSPNGIPYAAQVQQSEEIQEVRDELTIVKRQKKLLEKELQNVKDRRGAEVSGLHLEIEGLKLKLEQQDRILRRLHGDEGSSSPERNSGRSNRNRSVRVKCEGTDTI